MSLKSFFLNLLFPIECLGCRREGFWLCETCFRKLNFGSQDKHYNLSIPNLTKIFIAGDYDDSLLAEAIKKFKYNFIAALGEILGRFLILYWSGQKFLVEQNLREDYKKTTDRKKCEQLIIANPAGAANQNSAISLIVPLPLSKKRWRWRGFNQAEILGRELNAHFLYDLSLELKRAKHQKPQASLGEDERAENIKNAFIWTGADLSGRTIILVDDIVTTGATLNEAARVLKAAGAKRVYGLVLAKG